MSETENFSRCTENINTNITAPEHSKRKITRIETTS